MNRMNYGKRGISVILSALLTVMLILALVPAMAVNAAKNYTFRLDREDNISIAVKYTDKLPTIQIKSPARTYSKDADYTKVEKNDKEKMVTYRIDKAPYGDWTITSSTDIDYAVFTSGSQINIASFTYTDPKEEKITVKAKVTGPADSSSDLTVYAVSDTSATGAEQTKKLTSSWSRNNEEKSFDVSVSDLPDGKWHLTLEASCNYNGHDSAARTEQSKTFETAFEISKSGTFPVPKVSTIIETGKGTPIA